MTRGSGLAAIVAAMIVIGCSTVDPTLPVPSSRPSGSPSAGVLPSPTPSPSVAGLSISIEVAEQCGSEGGCAYYADLRDSAGEVTTMSLDPSRNPTTVPRLLTNGEYDLTLRSALVSDVIVNGRPPAESPDAACHETVLVAAGEALVLVRGAFLADSCRIEVTSS